MDLPIIRAHERVDFKRCQKKWYWKWRRGYVLRERDFCPLDLGTWMHVSLADFYRSKGSLKLSDLVATYSSTALRLAEQNDAPEHVIEEGERLAALAIAMASAYEQFYTDSSIEVIAVEPTFYFQIDDLAVHRITPDLVYRELHTGRIWLMEHKTAASIRTDFLVIDDQARAQATMVEQPLRRSVLKSNQFVTGVMYNFLRKAFPDKRPQNAQGAFLNKDGRVSKQQPPPYFLRHPVTLTRRAKVIALRRIRQEVTDIVTATAALKQRTLDPMDLRKTPHYSCSRTCDFFRICTAEENGVPTGLLEEMLYTRKNPYEQAETTDEPASFDM